MRKETKIRLGAGSGMVVLLLIIIFLSGCAGPRSRNGCLVAGGLAYVLTKNPSVAAAGCAIGGGIGGHRDMRADEEKNKPVNKVEVGEFINLDGGGKKAVSKSPTPWIRGARVIVSVDSYYFSQKKLVRAAVEEALRAKGATIIASTSSRDRYSDEGLGATHVAKVSVSKERTYVAIIISVVNKTTNEMVATGRGQVLAGGYYADVNYHALAQRAVGNLK